MKALFKFASLAALATASAGIYAHGAPAKDGNVAVTFSGQIPNIRASL